MPGGPRSRAAALTVSPVVANSTSVAQERDPPAVGRAAMRHVGRAALPRGRHPLQVRGRCRSGTVPESHAPP